MTDIDTEVKKQLWAARQDEEHKAILAALKDMNANILTLASDVKEMVAAMKGQMSRQGDDIKELRGRIKELEGKVTGNTMLLTKFGVIIGIVTAAITVGVGAAIRKLIG